MSIERLARTMQARMPWRAVEHTLKSNEIARGRGFDNTIRKLLQSEAELAPKLPQLEEAVRQHVMCGEKLVEFYRLSSKEMNSLRESVVELRPDEGPMTAAYPAILSEAEMSDVPLGVSKLVAIERNDDGVGLVFSTVAVVILEDPLDRTELPDDVADALSGYFELVGKRKAKVQTFEVLWIPHHDNLLELRVDALENLPADAVRDARTAFRAVVRDRIEAADLLLPVNLFPAITRIYESAGEGKVKEMAFGTTTSSIKQEHMKHGLCLRDEIYHVNGKAALEAPITPFKISVVWEVPASEGEFSNPELSLNGTRRMLASVNPILSNALFSNCYGRADYEFVKARLQKYILETGQPLEGNAGGGA